MLRYLMIVALAMGACGGDDGGDDTFHPGNTWEGDAGVADDGTNDLSIHVNVAIPDAGTAEYIYRCTCGTYGDNTITTCWGEWLLNEVGEHFTPEFGASCYEGDGCVCVRTNETCDRMEMVIKESPRLQTCPDDA